MIYFQLFVHELVHIAAYFLLVIIALIIFKPDTIPWKNMILGLLVTVFMDADHLVDYFLYKRNLAFSLSEFIDLNYFELLGKTYIPLHAWEWVVLLLIVYFALRKKYQFILFIALGMFSQLLVDSLSYGFDWRVYFITYRFLNNFEQSLFSIG